MVDVPKPKPHATYEDLLKVPDHLVAEILDDELIVSPRPAPRHANAASEIGGDLTGPFQRGRGGPGGWWILYEPELHLGRAVVVPDVAGWRRERMPTLPETAYFPLAPDWVCEVLSPSTARVDRLRKLRIYARERVGYAWLVDPIARVLESYRLEGERWLLLGTFGEDEKARVEPFEAIELELAGWWAD